MNDQNLCIKSMGPCQAMVSMGTGVFDFKKVTSSSYFITYIYYVYYYKIEYLTI